MYMVYLLAASAVECWVSYCRNSDPFPAVISESGTSRRCLHRQGRHKQATLNSSFRRLICHDWQHIPLVALASVALL